MLHPCQAAQFNLIFINNSRRFVWYQKKVALLQLTEPISPRTPLALLVISLSIIAVVVAGAGRATDRTWNLAP